MTKRHEQAQEILEIFTPHRLYELIEDAKDLIHLYDDMVKYENYHLFEQTKGYLTKVRIKRTLSLLSKFAYKNADELKKIKDQCGYYWVEDEI